MCIRLILATNNGLREKPAIGCGLVEAWVQFLDRETNLSIRCKVQSGSKFCPACFPMGVGARFQG
jgi:hypothetical protein